MKFGPQDRNPLAGQPQAGLWFGKTDDLWNFGKPTGTGGVWYNTDIQPAEVSDPYLMYGFDKKSVHLYQDSPNAIEMTIETDFMSNGEFKAFKTIKIAPGEYIHYEFPDGYSAQWMRISSDKACKATAMVIYH